MTRLIIIRHAESSFNHQNRIQGHLDSHLTPKGLRQARRLAKRIRDFKLDKVYSSDLGRAWTTTLEITKHHRARIVRDPLLREIHLGKWEGMTPEEVDRLYDRGYERWLLNPSSIVIPGGERVGHFRKRITGRIRVIARANRGKTVLVVMHGGAITALLADWLKADFDTLLTNFHIENTSLTVAEETETRVRLRLVGDVSHLSKREKNEHNIFSKRT